MVANTPHKRLFIGCKIDKELTQDWCNLIKKKPYNAPQKARWVTANNAHITLSFLGEICEDKIDLLTDHLKKNTNECSPFSAEFIKIDHFPSPKGRMIAVYLRLNLKMANLYKKLNLTVGKLGFKLDKKPFIPHITLMRLNSMVENPMPAISINNQPSLLINEIILYESQQTQDGVCYKPLTIFSLPA